MWPNPQEIMDLVIFTEEILNGKLHFLCSALVWILKKSLETSVRIRFEQKQSLWWEKLGEQFLFKSSQDFASSCCYEEKRGYSEAVYNIMTRGVWDLKKNTSKEAVRYWANTKPIVREAQRCNTGLSLDLTFRKIAASEEEVYSEATFFIVTMIPLKIFCQCFIFFNSYLKILWSLAVIGVTTKVPKRG